MTVNGWIIFQQRIDGPASNVSFDVNWTDYKNGFGHLGGDYWMGNEKVHLLTTSGTWKLRMEMLFPAYGWMSAEYSYFTLDSETNNYTIHLSGYSGDCGDSMQYTGLSGMYHNGKGLPQRMSSMITVLVVIALV